MGGGMRTYDGITRTEARRFECPNCGAQPGEKCNGGRRESNHRERVHAAAQARGVAVVGPVPTAAPVIENDDGAVFDLRIMEGGEFLTPGGIWGRVSIALDRMEPGAMLVEVTIGAARAVKVEVDLAGHAETVMANLGEAPR
jgi:hypothetical protein